MDSPPLVDLGRVAHELHLKSSQVDNVVALADAGNTVPFITRYRKERTGNLDEELIRKILQRVSAMRQLAERAAAILRLIEAQGKLTPELRTAIQRADSLKRLEDLYLPFKPKKRSRASLARERGLEPLAEQIWNQDHSITSLEATADSLLNVEQGLATRDDVLQGAGDILAERISENADIRAAARKIAWRTGTLTTNATEKGTQQGQSFRDYFNHTEPISKIPHHRVLAMNRGEHSGVLKVKFDWDGPQVVAEVVRLLRLSEHRFGEFLFRCVNDSLDRMIQPSLDRELRREITERAESHAVAVFAKNLRNLLLQPPLPGRRVLAIDPGFRTGCKVVVLEETGLPLAREVIFVSGSEEKRTGSKSRLAALLSEHNTRLIAIGNGTACRETEELVTETISELVADAQYVIVNEAGASIYSTSTVAREEFPTDDATVRGTISIGRRLQDPLSELVKIEPQHLGVGMYQHDLSLKSLQETLDQVIESCVNFVGVDLNTASASLLRYVSGLNQLTARRVVEWRTEHGRFIRREQLLEVPGLGDASYTQAAGFLKITGGDEPLDATWIHPESYPVARQLLAKLSFETPTTEPESARQVNRPCGETAGETCGPTTFVRVSPEQAARIDAEMLASEFGVGVPTLRDILDSLARPGRDPRTDLAGPIFKKGILKLDDLQPGMELHGTVLNVVDFGAFVDVGLKDSGLVHISQLSHIYVRSPHELVSVGDVVTVWVLSVDQARKRVSLTMIRPGTQATKKSSKGTEKTSGEPPSPAASATPRGIAPATEQPVVSDGAPKSPPRSRSDTPRHHRRKRQKSADEADQKLPPLSADALAGSEPLTSFGQLKQLWTHRDSES